MKKQGKSPAKKIKCGLWVEKEDRFLTIAEYNDLKKIENPVRNYYDHGLKLKPLIGKDDE